MRLPFSRLVEGRQAKGGPKEDDLAFDELDWSDPPATTVDPLAWDRYWRDQVTHGAAGFVDLFCDDGPLVDAMRDSGLRTVLCVGNGISQEARALASAGFDVTALDLSALAMEIAEEAVPPPEYLSRLIGGRAFGEHGMLRFVVGDLRDESTCPGPFDVVIERRTLQLFEQDERPQALRSVADRLATPGIFFSHCHDGSWRPPASPKHANEEWFRDEGWQRWQEGSKASGRVVWLFTSTG